MWGAQFANPLRMLFLNQHVSLSSQRGRHSPSVCFTSKGTWLKLWQWWMHSKHPIFGLSPHLSTEQSEPEIRRAGGAWTSVRSSNVCVQRPLWADTGLGAFTTTLAFPRGVFFSWERSNLVNWNEIVFKSNSNQEKWGKMTINLTGTTMEPRWQRGEWKNWCNKILQKETEHRWKSDNIDSDKLIHAVFWGFSDSKT